jgi:hypothetical protein
MDFQCLNSFEKYSKFDQVFLGKMGTLDESEHSIPNALMASPPFDGFWIFYLSEICKTQSHILENNGNVSQVEHVTGPIALRNAFHEYVRDNAISIARVHRFLAEHAITFDRSRLCFSKICILPSHVWYPINWKDKLHDLFRVKILADKTLLSTQEARLLFPYSDAVTYWAHSWDGSNSA